MPRCSGKIPPERKRRHNAAATGAFFKKQFARGSFHATDVVEGSQAVCSDVSSNAPPEIKDWGTVTLGKNTDRGLFSCLDDCGSPELYMAYLPAWDPKINQKTTMQASFLLHTKSYTTI